MTILEWNINQASNYSGDNSIPDFVFEDIESQDKDIIVLVEYCDTCKNSAEFIHKLEGIGYNVVINDSNSKISQNDVLIGFKRSKLSLDASEKAVFRPTAQGNYPEMLAVKLTDKLNSFVVVGTRIRLCGNDKRAWEKRRAQLSEMPVSVSERYGEKNVIIAGDFNNNRVDLENCNDKEFVDVWSINVIDEIIRDYGLSRKTPTSGASIYQLNSPFKGDHILASPAFQVETISYSREFTEHNSGVYLHGEEFSVYNRNLEKTTWSIQCGSGVPDHAMLLAELSLPDPLLISNYFQDGGETHTREELILRLFCDAGLERSEAERLIDYCVEMGFIYDAGNDCYVK